jgi:FKBP-type peptidyl-prolyl cis-trans isomerase FklB
VKQVLPILFLATATASLSALAGEPLNFEDESTRINYSLGYQIGADFKRQNVQVNADAVVQGIEDGLSDVEPKMSAEDMHTSLMALKQKIIAEKRKQALEEERKLLADGDAFIEENARKEGVTTTESGLQYKVIQEGTGKSPGSEDTVVVQYRGTTIDGTEFDSSYKRGKPATLRLNGVIQGWSEGLQRMKEGGKAQFFIPPNLAYGKRGPLAFQTLIFDVELVSVGESEQAKTPEQGEPQEKKQ